MAAKLSLAVRKNLRDAEATWKPSLDKIRKIIGVEWKVVQNWEELYFSVSESNRDRIGDAIGGYLEGIASNIEYKIKSPKAKAALVSAVSANSVKFVAGPLDPGAYYQQVKIIDGVLVHVASPDSYYCNCGDAGSQICRLLTVGNLPLFTVENIDENAPKVVAHMAAISKAMGAPWTFEINYEEIFATLPDGGDFESGYRWRLGECLLWYLDALQPKLVSLAKDDMIREAIGEAASKKIIRFVLGETANAYSYNETRFTDGVLEVVVPADKFCVNCDGVGSNIESIL